MKIRVFAFIFFIVIFVNLVNAEVKSSGNLEVTFPEMIFTPDKSDFYEFSVKNKGSGNITVDFNTPFSIGSDTFDITDGDNNIPAGKTNKFNISGSINFDKLDFMEGDSGVLHVKERDTSNKVEIDVVVFNEVLCEGKDKYLDIDIENVDVDKGFGDDKEWYPFDGIKVEVKVDNDHSKLAVEDINFRWGLYDVKNFEWYFEEDESDFDLDDGKSRTFDLDFDLDADVDELVGGDFVLYAWARGDLDDSSNTLLCVDDSEDIDVEIVDDLVVLDSIELPDSIACGKDLKILADVWNIGVDNQKNLYVKIYNDDLGMSEIVRFDRINSFDREDLDFSFKIPEDTEEKVYPINFRVYDSRNKVYDANRKNSYAFSNLKVKGDCVKKEFIIDVSAEIEKDGKPGEELRIVATARNTGNVAGTFGVSIEGYDKWAELVSLDKSSVTIDAGESETMNVVFRVKEDVGEGVQRFAVKLNSAGGSVIEQPISVQIKSGFFDGKGYIIFVVIGILVVIAVLFFVLSVILKKRPPRHH